MARRGEQPTPFSYAAAAVGGGLTLLLAAYLAFDAMRSKAPARIAAVVVAAEMRQEGGSTYVPIEVTNRGDRAAAQVVVEARGGSRDTTVQSVIDYLAGGETRRVVAVVPGGSRDAVEARVLGYQEP